MSPRRTAVIVPCYNEEPTIEKVVSDFRVVLPDAAIYVIDNNSSDRTADIAARAGATVLTEKRQGKGEVVKAVCGEIDAEYFILVDGDDTYPAAEALRLLDPLLRGEADMVIGSRRHAYEGTDPRPFHRGGNDVVCFLVNRIFGSQLTDVMSGYRAFTGRVAMSLPLISMGFDVETEMTIQMLYRRYVLKEVPVGYRKRPPASLSKLRTFSDGFRVLLKIFVLLVAYKPLTVFGSMALIAGFAGGALVAFGLSSYSSPAGPQLQVIGLGTAGVLAGVLFLSLGLTISSVNWRVRELESYLVKLVARPVLPHRGLAGDARGAGGAVRLRDRFVQSSAADQNYDE